VSIDSQVRDLEDDRTILPVLESDRLWAAYALCDLDPPFRAHARFLGFLERGIPTSILLVYDLPDFSVLVSCGAEPPLSAILSAGGRLPAEVSFHVRESELVAVQHRYTVLTADPMFRMVTDQDHFREPPPVSAELAQLSMDHASRLQRLYAEDEGAVFNPEMLENGVYFGAVIAGELVSVAGTHAVSRRRTIAAVGGVYTLPAHRGQGLATAVTAAVTSQLIAGGVRDVVLNVKQNNFPAIAAYRRIGYRIYMPFVEGTARLKPD
jgi:ribosomal protein S18 acetylase RimI-like enzyme